MKTFRRRSVNLDVEMLSAQEWQAVLNDKIKVLRQESQDCDGSCQSCAVRTIAEEGFNRSVGPTELAQLVHKVTAD